jgi:hypothetical protein
MSSHVNGNDGFGARSDRHFGQLGIKAVGVGRNIDGNGYCASVQHRAGSRDKRVVGNDNFIAWADTSADIVTSSAAVPLVTAIPYFAP